MLRCGHGSKDLLLAHFLSKHVNLLDPPRRRVALGTTFVTRGRDITDQPLAALVDGPLDVVPSPTNSGVVEVFEEILSGELSLDTGASVAGLLLQALGVEGTEPKIADALRKMGTDFVTVSLSNLTVERLDRKRLEASLEQCLLRPGSLVDGTRNYFVTVGTWSATELHLRAEKKLEGYLEASADLQEVLTADGKVTVRRGDQVQTILKSTDALVFGVEVMRIGREGDGLVLIDRRLGTRLRAEEEDSVEELKFMVEGEAFVAWPPPR